jgi:protoporphyrinogen oxidase
MPAVAPAAEDTWCTTTIEAANARIASSPGKCTGAVPDWLASSGLRRAARGVTGHPRPTWDQLVAIIGAGPAGLTAAFQFHKAGVSSTILEADRQVGGISRTAQRDGWRFDIGGHRFFTKVHPGGGPLARDPHARRDFLMRPRKSRIFYEGKYYDYPIKAMNALRNLGPSRRAVRAVVPLGAGAPAEGPDELRGMARRPNFGWRLYRTFFKTYTEKLWGVPVSRRCPPTGRPSGSRASRCGNAIVNALHAAEAPNQNQITSSLIEEFQYPKYGPG